MNIANKLTVGRIALVFVFMLVIWNPFLSLEASLWGGLIIFIIASFTDFLDGYIARKYQLITDLGKFMDPLADKMLVTAAMIALVDKADVLPAGTLPAWIVVVILLREFTISGIRLLAATNQVVIAANQLGKIKTILQMAMIIVYLTPISHPVWQSLALILAYAALLLTIVSGVQYIWQNKEVLATK